MASPRNNGLNKICRENREGARDESGQRAFSGCWGRPPSAFRTLPFQAMAFLSCKMTHVKEQFCCCCH